MKTEIIHGLRAALAVIAKRPGDVRRIAYSRAVEAELPRGLKAQELSERELERIAKTPHHEGLVVEAIAGKWTTPSELGDILMKRNGTAIALDRVRNPYNVGAIVRSAAFFGVDAVLLGPTASDGLDPQAIRVAEGGMEHVALCRTTDLADSLVRLRTRGVKIVGADGGSESEALGYAFERPTILVLGNEREGLAPRVRSACDAIVGITGSGVMESLNVAVAASVLIAELLGPKRTH